MAESKTRPARDVSAERLARPLEARYREPHSHDAYSGIKGSDLIALLNELFGPGGWTVEVLSNEIVRDEVRPHPRNEKHMCRYVTAQATARVSARTREGTIRREAVGVHSASAVIYPPPVNKPGQHGSATVRLAITGAGTNAWKRAANLIGEATGSKLSELEEREMARREREEARDEEPRRQREARREPSARDDTGTTSRARDDDSRGGSGRARRARDDTRNGRTRERGDRDTSGTARRARDDSRGERTRERDDRSTPGRASRERDEPERDSATNTKAGPADWNPELHDQQSAEFRTDAKRLAGELREARSRAEGREVCERATRRLRGLKADPQAVKQVLARLEARAAAIEEW